MLSIIIPTLNESKAGYLHKMLQRYASLQHCEIICVDGGSSDNTLDVIEQSSAQLIKTSIHSRAGRLNVGVEAAKYELVLLHHPRSIIQLAGLQTLMAQADQVCWGAFTHKFDYAHPILRFTSWYSNFVRGGLRNIYYLDHCLFVQKSLLQEIGLVPDWEIFEDTELCLRLKQHAKGTRLPAISLTSAIRFLSNDIYKQVLLNQKLKWQYYFKQSDKLMNKEYEQGLELNSPFRDMANSTRPNEIESNVHK